MAIHRTWPVRAIRRWHTSKILMVWFGTLLACGAVALKRVEIGEEIVESARVIDETFYTDDYEFYLADHGLKRQQAQHGQMRWLWVLFPVPGLVLTWIWAGGRERAQPAEVA